jgi:hypothetical protein
VPLERRPLEIVDRHLLVRFPDGLALLDTGSPGDIGRGRELSICGAVRVPGVAHREVLDVAGAHLGVHLEWLLGFPCFREHRVRIDWRGGTVTFATGSMDLRGATSVSIDLALPVPMLTLSAAGIAHQAVLDTGAALSYVPRAATLGIAPHGTTRDFHPTIGAFETSTWRVPIVIGDRAIALEAGTLPDALERTLGPISGGWILGSDFFRDRVVVIDYPAERVLDAPGDAG